MNLINHSQYALLNLTKTLSNNTILLLYHSPFITMLCKLQGTNQSDKINISTIDFLVAQELSWFGPRTL